MASTSTALGRRIKRADPSTIQDKFLVGYQGWFTCPGDGEPVGPGHHGWLHWFNAPIPDGGHPNIDLWPDVSACSPSELYPAPGLTTTTGEQAVLFSSRNAKTVQRHFHWMAEHGVDGAFLQRFAGQTDLETGSEGIRRIRDEVGDRVREAAEKEDRVFAIMYDVSGVPADRIARVLENDWMHLMREKNVLDSPNYLKEKGKPVIALWGFGFDGAGHTPALIRSIVAYFRSATPGGVYLMAGTPAFWRTSDGDADRNPEMVDVWLNEFDAISPWTIGRYGSEQEADNFAETRMKPDSELLKKRAEEGHKKINYVPVVFPGGSGYNMSEGKWAWNGIKRNGGRFLWKQIYNAHKLGVRIMYGAMWDEYDEGTAFMPVVPSKQLLPESDRFKFMALNEDGYDLPSDWYMRICGFAAEVFHHERRIFETFPSKELQDYWSNHPKYEDVPAHLIASGSGSAGASGAGGLSAGVSGSGADGDKKVGGDGQSYEEWLAAQKEDKEEAPPPPYSLEAEEVPAAVTAPVIAAASSNSAPVPSPTVSAPAVVASSPTVPPSRASGPPPVNTSTRPGQQSLGPSYGTQDPVTSLTNDFGRATVSQPASPGALNATSLAPPLHPAHPAASGSGQGAYGAYGRSSSQPGSRPQSSAGPPRPQPQLNMATHPSASPSPHGYGSAPQQQQEQNTSGPWSQGQWPPPEWKVNNTSPTSVPYPVYNSSGTPGGANLTRPHTYSAGHHSAPSVGGGADLRPSATISGPGGRPSYGGQLSSSVNTATSPGPSFPMGPSAFGGSGPGLSPYPNAASPSGYLEQRPTSPYPPMGPGPQGVSTYPGQQSSYPGQHTSPSTYPGQYQTSTYPGQQQTLTYPGQQPYPPHPAFHNSPPHSPPAGSISYPSTTTDPSKGGPSGYHPSYQPASPHSGPGHVPHPISPPPPGIHFSQGPGEYGHGPHMGGPVFPGGPQSGYGGYPPQQNQYGQHGGPVFPHAGPGAGVNSGPWASPPPPRPITSPNASGPSFPVASTAGQQAFGLALSAVDKVAGKKTREQLEAAGSKLFGKFK